LRRSRKKSRGIDAETLAKLIALKAHFVGRRAVADGSVAAHEKLAARALDALTRKSDDSEESLRRQVFYTLVLAELERQTGAIQHRRAAKILGHRLGGTANPFPVYMKLVALTMSTHRARDWGTVDAARITAVIEEERLVEELDLSPSVLRQFRGLLYEHTLESMMERHGLIRGRPKRQTS
jgi:hypothetical protein